MAEFRRTDYPALANILQNTSSDVPQGKFIKRVRYPDNESSNPNNLPHFKEIAFGGTLPIQTMTMVQE